MFVGRKRELARLTRAADEGTFQLAVVYGRRRVGKTALIQHFSEGRRTLFYTALEQGDKGNLQDFSRSVSEFFGSTVAFGNWKDALSYVADRAEEEPFVFVFDEFPYAAKRQPALPSILQVLIDHRLKQTACFLILCGSSQGFMESEVLGYKSPLFGRRTLQMKLEPLRYREASEMLPGLSPQDAFRAYACFGGVPYYLERFDTRESLTENLARLFFDPSGLLFDEPLMLLRQELAEPAVYNSLLRAIAGGATRQGEIADRAGVETAGVSSYLHTLIELGLIERRYPFGENPETSRKGGYRIKEAAFAFWYRFVMPRAQAIEAGLGEIEAAALTDEVLATYMGPKFEEVCRQWLVDQALCHALPLEVTGVGSWWGTDPKARETTDIDVLAADPRSRLLIGECKYRNSFNETDAMRDLEARKNLVKDHEAHWFYLFTRHELTQATQAKIAEAPEWFSVTLDDLYR